jgi:hypothetical protein
MILSRRAAWFLVGFAVWNLYVWATFVKNVWPDHHFDAFFMAHLAIGSFTVVLGGIAGAIGVRGVRASRRVTPPGPSGLRDAGD